MPEERLQKILSRAGVASRRASEDLIKQGRVTIDGERAELGAKVDPSAVTIRVDGEIIKTADSSPVYIMLNKPSGVVSAVSAQRQESRPTVRDLVEVEGHLYPVGRLDADSEGLILLTNDGDLTQRLTHPRYGHKKTYRVQVRGLPTPEQLDQWAKGVELSDGKTAPCTVEIKKTLEKATWLQVKMGEGRKRQIRRTAIAVGLHVDQLIRTHIGKLRLTGLKPGEWRYLTDDEIKLLKSGLRSANRPQGGKRRRGSGQSSRSSNPRSRKQNGGKSDRSDRSKR
jgi:23S rRNA pseudouridine2605 synthase